MIRTGLFALVVIVLLLGIGLFTGYIPGLGSSVQTTTINNEYGGLRGQGELIGPNNRQGFITSHLNDGFSQTITCIGKACIDTWGTGGIQKYRYMVYGRKLSGGWEEVSTPTSTSMYISNPNPGEIGISGFQFSGCKNFNAYSFEFVGNTYKAVKVVLEGYINPNVGFFWDYQWRVLQVDEANLFEGWGELTYPRDEQGLPVSTFEIGETGRIGVRTHYGGDTSENGKPWKVVMRYPQDRGGEIFKEESYKDNVDTYFTFTVSEDMYSKNSDNSYQVEIYNTLVPKGELLVKTIDVKAKAPGEVHLTGPIKAKDGETVTIQMSASVNSVTQLPISSFQVAVFYGEDATLMPSDPFSDRWILPVSMVTPSGGGSEYKYTLSFTADKGRESWVSVLAWAYDTEGRSSVNPKVFSVYIYLDTPPADEAIEDQAGEGYYYGGHTEGWQQWIPDGNWPDGGVDVNWLGVFFCILITLGMAMLGFLLFSKEPRWIVFMALVGLVIGIVVYALFFTTLFTGVVGGI